MKLPSLYSFIYIYTLHQANPKLHEFRILQFEDELDFCLSTIAQLTKRMQWLQMDVPIDILNNMEGIEVATTFWVSAIAVDKQTVDKMNQLQLSTSVLYDYVAICLRTDLYEFIYIYFKTGQCVEEYLCYLYDKITVSLAHEIFHLIASVVRIMCPFRCCTYIMDDNEDLIISFKIEFIVPVMTKYASS